MNSAVIGLGYVGLPLALEAARAGFKVWGIDVSAEKVKLANQGKSYIVDVTDQELKEAVRSGKFKATTDFDVLKHAQAISICVPTPLRKTKDPDVSYIYESIQQIKPRFRKGQLIVLESTTYPGTTEELVLTELTKSGLKPGKDFFLAFSPERVDPGNPKYKTFNIPKVIGGITPECTRKAVEYYSKIFPTVVPVSSARSAEMVKMLENVFRSVNIALVNEIAIICNKLGIDVWEVIEAAKTKPFGFMPFYPGPGLGGHCIPIDPLYLSWKLKSYNYHARFIELATEINSYMPYYACQKITHALNRQGKPVRGSQVLILGVAYKRDVSDTRESPAMEIIQELKNHGAHVKYHDPYVPQLPEFTLKSSRLTRQLLQKSDCVAIITDHSDYDYKFICDHAPIVVDTRNATAKVKTRTPIIKI